MSDEPEIHDAEQQRLFDQFVQAEALQFAPQSVASPDDITGGSASADLQELLTCAALLRQAGRLQSGRESPHELSTASESGEPSEPPPQAAESVSPRSAESIATPVTRGPTAIHHSGLRHMSPTGAPTEHQDVASNPMTGFDLTECGQWLDQYELREVLGRGGFGTVFHAFDHALKREVAIKIPRVETILSPDACRRFLKEARASANLTHDAIVRVFETVESPQPAIVYEYCNGGTLRDYQGPHLNERTAVEILIRLCGGLRHAHSRGILHRDIKPSNILMAGADDDSVNGAIRIGDYRVVPKLSDFGLAKLIEDDLGETQTGLIIGTPGFMAPEQTTGHTADTGTHTDIYSLGAVLYWLLTNARPYQAESPTTTIALMHSQDPIPVRERAAGVSREVANICSKCLQRRPEDRYETVAALQRDLEAFQRGEPVSVRSPSLLAIVRQYRRRHPVRSTIALVMVLLLTVGVVLETVHSRLQSQLLGDLDDSNRRLTVAADAARRAGYRVSRQNARYEELLYAADMQLAVRSKQDGDVAATEVILRRHIPDAGKRDLRDVEWYLLWQETHGTSKLLDQFDDAGYFISVSGDGRYFAGCSADGLVRIYDSTTLQKVQTIHADQGEVNAVTFSGDAQLLTTAGDDGAAKIWNWRAGREVQRVQTKAKIAYNAVLNEAGDCVYTCGNHLEIQAWDLADGTSTDLTGHEGSVDAICLSRDNRYLYSAGSDGYRGVFDLTENSLLARKSAFGGQRVTSVAPFSVDGRYFLVSGLLSSESQHFVLLEEADTDRRWRLPMQADGVQSVAVSNSTGMAAIGNRSGLITLVDLRQVMDDNRDENPEAIRGRWVTGHGRVYGMAWHPDRQGVLSTGSDGQLRLWQVGQDDQVSTTPQIVRESVRQRDELAAATSDMNSLYFIHEGKLYCWQRTTDQVQPLAEGFAELTRLFVSEQHHQLLSFSDSAGLQMWSIDSTTDVTHLWTCADLDSSINSVVWSQDGQNLVVAERWSTRPVRILAADDGSTVREHQATDDQKHDNYCVAVSPDESLLAYCAGHAAICIDRSSGKHVRLDGHTSTTKSMCFVPADAVLEDPEAAWCLVTGSRDRTVRVWDLTSGKLVHELHGHAGVVDSVVTSSGGRSLVSAGSLGDVLIWSLRSGVLVREYFGAVPGRSVSRRVYEAGIVEVDRSTGAMRFLHWPGTMTSRAR